MNEFKEFKEFLNEGKTDKQITSAIMSIDARSTNMLASWDDGEMPSKKDVESLSKEIDKLKKLVK